METQTMSEMERLTLRVPSQRVRALEALVDDGEYPNRSEAIRAAIRQHIADTGAKDTYWRYQKKHARI